MKQTIFHGKLPFIAGSILAISFGVIVGSVQTKNEDLRSFAKTKSCRDYSSAAMRNACLGTNGQAPTSCPSGMVPCGVTNSCTSYSACKDAGVVQNAGTTPKAAPTKKPTQIAYTPLNPAPAAVITPAAPLTNNKCPADMFVCPCGCFTAKQFTTAQTDKCSVMCAKPTAPGVTPVKTATPVPTFAVIASIVTTTPIPIPAITTPIPTYPTYVTTPSTLPYYSQANPGIADSNLPGENCTYIAVGCGEVTVANILTHNGVPTTPDQAVEQTKGGKCQGTTYTQDIQVLQNNGFQTIPYTASFDNLTTVMQPNDSLWLSVHTNQSNIGHHTYIDGYTIVNGQPVYNLRDPYYGSDLKCTVDGDRTFACSSPKRSLKISAPPDTNNDGQDTVAILVRPPGM